MYKRKFYEIAIPKRELEKMIRDLQDTLNEHLLKILLYPDEKELIAYWKKEIASKLVFIQLRKSKHNNWFLSKEQYFNLLYTELIDGKEKDNKGDIHWYRYMINDIITVNQDIVSTFDEDRFPFIKWNNIIVKFYMEVSTKLSLNQLTRIEIFSLIDKYFK